MEIQNLFDPQMSSRTQSKLLLYPHSLSLKPETSHKVSSALEEPSLISNPSPRRRRTNTARLCPRAAFDMRQRSPGSLAVRLAGERRDLKSLQLLTQPPFTPTSTCLHLPPHRTSCSTPLIKTPKPEWLRLKKRKKAKALIRTSGKEVQWKVFPLLASVWRWTRHERSRMMWMIVDQEVEGGRTADWQQATQTFASPVSVVKDSPVQKVRSWCCRLFFPHTNH